MCTLPHPVAVKAHCMFMETNLGDPGLFSGTASLERLLIERLGTLFHLPEAGGYATSGGTESNIQALRLAKVQQNEVSYPNIVVPESAHFSFKKASDLLYSPIGHSLLAHPGLEHRADRTPQLLEGFIRHAICENDDIFHRSIC